MKKNIFWLLLWILPISAVSNNRFEKEVDSITHLIGKYHFTQDSIAMNLVEQLYSLANLHAENKTILAQAIFWETSVEFSQGRNNAAILDRIDSVLQFYDQEKDPYEYALLLYAQSVANMIKGNYPEASQLAIHTLELMEKIDNKFLLFKTLNLLGTLYPYIQNYNMAEYYYNQAADLATPAQVEYYQLSTNKFRILFLRGETEKAIDSLEAILPEIEKFQDTALYAIAKLNLAVCYFSLDQLEKAYDCYMSVMNITQNINNNSFKIVVNNNLSNYFYKRGDFDEAYRHALIAKKMAEKNDNIEQLSYIVHIMSAIFEAQGKIDSAYYYLQEYNRVREYLMNNPKTVEVYQLYASMLMESSENKLKIANQELIIKDKQMMVTILSAVVIIAVIGLILIITLQNRRNIRQKSLLREVENKDLANQLEHQKKIEALQNEKLDAQMREISSYSLLLSNKNALLQQILDNIGQYSMNHEKADKVIQKIESVAKNNLYTDKDWNDFILHFEKVHPRFFEKLQNNYPELTKNDLKLCVYIRIGMSMKQIAQMLNIFPDSVKTNRYRLKRKFNLSESQSLDNFIQEF